jgi:Tfp pilus assembly protein PilF
VNRCVRIRARAVHSARVTAVTLGVFALCAGTSHAIGSPPHHERVPLELINRFPLNPGGAAAPNGARPTARQRSPRASVRQRSGSKPSATPGVPPILLMVVVAVVSVLALAGVRGAVRRRPRGPVLGPELAAVSPAQVRSNRVRHTAPERRPWGGQVGEAAFRVALELEQQGDLRGAEKAYRRAAESGDLAAESNLGVLLHLRGELEAAKQHYRRALEGEPAGGFNLGVLLEQQRDIAGARTAYRGAHRRGHAAAASNLGVLLEQAGDFGGAQAAFSRAAERGDPKGAFNLGMMLEEQGDLERALAAYRRAGEYRRAGAPTSATEASGAPRASA